MMRQNLLILCLTIFIAGCEKQPDMPARDLFSAVKKGDVELVRRELARGVSPDYYDEEHGFLIQSALFPKSTDMLALLIKSGANVNARKLEGDGALLHAVITGECEHARLLLAAGADLNERYTSYYMYAAEVEFKNKNVVQLYFQYKERYANAWKKNESCWRGFETSMKAR